MNYNPGKIEAKWQKKWQEENLFKFKDSDLPKKYVLEMFPYPSGKLHMGHVRNYTLGDVYARFQRMNGYNVLHPMGFDAFGLPAENAAMENKVYPSAWTYKNIELMKKGIESIGISYDFTGDVITCNPNYYKHEQAIFIDFLSAGLAYKKESYVNWDPVDMTVLANEQVVDGKGWRSGAAVQRKKLSQWFLRITSFADDLLDSLDTLTDWPENVKTIQRKWIGKSTGATMKFAVDNGEMLEIFSTRPDTIYGASFIVIAAGHSLSIQLAEKNPAIAAFIKEMEKIGTQEEDFEKAEKIGIDTGLKATVPLAGKEVPIFIASYVLMDYGTGAVFGCPAHDERDHEFALKYGLEIIQVVKDDTNHDVQKSAFTGQGIIVNSSSLDALSTEEAVEKAITMLEESGLGAKSKMYRLRDWGISRQRYWGCPIPIIYCDSCGTVPVPKEQLPVTLPEDVDFSVPGNPLDRHASWKHTECPKCNKEAVRETDTFDTFFESSWYFIRFCSPLSDKPFEKEMAEKLLPVDKYIGGIEHAAMHLLYARFFTKALTKCGYFNISEPFKGLVTQGMVLHATYKDANGKWLFPKEAKTIKGSIEGRIEKMSKSKKNLVEPDDIIGKYGADAIRLFMMSDNPPEKDFEWTDGGVDGAYRFLTRLYKYAHELAEFKDICQKQPNAALLDNSIYRLVRALGNHYEKLEFNSGVARIREIWNIISSHKLSQENASSAFASFKLLVSSAAPIVPHLADELWSILGLNGMLFNYNWPKIDDRLCQTTEVTIAVQINGKLRDTLVVAKNMPRDRLEELVFALPKVKNFINGGQVKKVIIIQDKICNVVI